MAAVLFKDVQIFNGKDNGLSAASNVLVKGNRIAKIATGDIPFDHDNTKVIDGGGKTLMPGLIDAHWHSMLAAMGTSQFMAADAGDINLIAADAATGTLLRGFTSVRDLSGPAFALKRAVDAGYATGPRVWPSGAMISQSGGHGDFRFPWEVPSSDLQSPGRAQALNAGVIADGPDEVRKRVREQLMLGASQIKLAAGGGVASNYDPIDVAQYTEEEFRAAVGAAENWGTYVTVHAYTPRAIQTAIAGGVKVIEHGQLMDEDTAKLMADKGIWLSTQPFLDNEFANPTEGEARQKQLEVAAGTDRAYKLAKQYGLKVAFGTDMLFDPAMLPKQGAILTTMSKWYSPFEVLRMATSQNAELLGLSGPRNPYPGKLGVVDEGALADLILVDGNPLEKLDLVADPTNNFVVIMKDGKLYKDNGDTK